jgi:hypothetical protein
MQEIYYTVPVRGVRYKTNSHIGQVCANLSSKGVRLVHLVVYTVKVVVLKLKNVLLS